MDIAVSPRATFYASPMKILEYMAMGIPTVAPDMPNITDMVTDGTDAVLLSLKIRNRCKMRFGRCLKTRLAWIEWAAQHGRRLNRD